MITPHFWRWFRSTPFASSGGGHRLRNEGEFRLVVDREGRVCCSLSGETFRAVNAVRIGRSRHFEPWGENIAKRGEK